VHTPPVQVWLPQQSEPVVQVPLRGTQHTPWQLRFPQHCASVLQAALNWMHVHTPWLQVRLPQQSGSSMQAPLRATQQSELWQSRPLQQSAGVEHVESFPGQQTPAVHGVVQQSESPWHVPPNALQQAPPVQEMPLAQHPFPQVTPPWRHAAAAPPQVEVATLAHAMPAVQQAWPHGVVPAGHPHVPVAGF
jgi:hypothetical protein